MKYVCISPNEARTTRFDRLCSHLEADTPADRVMVLGHLMLWHFRWAGDTEIDNGLLYDVNTKRMGIWAEHPEPQKFGNALLAARYIAPLESVYPAALLLGRTGFVALTADGGAMLDVSWSGWHRKAQGRERNSLYILDPEQRARAYGSIKVDPCAVARACGIDPEALPNGWTVGPRFAAGGQEPYESYDTGPDPGRPEGGPSPDPGRPEGGLSRAGAPPRAPAPAPLITSETLKKELNQSTNRSERTVDNSSDRIPGCTGRKKSAAMLADLRAFQRDGWLDPMGALLRIDDGAKATKTWEAAIACDVGFVIQVLSELIETDNSFRTARNPAAVVNKRLFLHLQDQRARRRQ